MSLNGTQPPNLSAMLPYLSAFNGMMVGVIAQMSVTLPSDTSPASGAATILLLFSMLSHITSWSFATYTSLSSTSRSSTTSGMVICIGPIFTLLGTLAWMAAVLLRIYPTVTFTIFVVSCLLLALFLIFTTLAAFITLRRG